MIIGNKTKTAKNDKDLWATPWDIFHGAEALFRRTFDLDACASSHNAKCKRYITAEQNILTCDWGEKGQNVWINPPYSDPTPFIQRAIEQSRNNDHFIVMLLPADTSVKWFRLCVQHAMLIQFITASENEGGRISFLHNASRKAVAGNSKGSMLVVFYGCYGSGSTGYISREQLIKLGMQEKQND
ncbi:phage N-6-adenine-methyltransferase [Ursidibacter sp. B-7004-1]